MKASARISARLWLARIVVGLVPNKFVDGDKLKALMAGRKAPKEAEPPAWIQSHCDVRRWTAAGRSATAATGA